MQSFDEKYLQYKREITVAVNDMDFNAKIKPAAIMGYLQDIAFEHAEILGFGYKDIQGENLAWAMVRMSFKVFESPKVGEVLTIRTFPEKPNTADVNRGYYIINGAGETIVAASSKWCVIDMETHAIKRCAPLFEKLVNPVFIPYPPLENANRKIEKLSDYGEAEEKPLVCAVRLTDLDYNIHMNNTRYGDVVLNVCGMEMLKSNVISRVDINFLSQLVIGDSFETHKAQKDNITYIEAKKSGCDSAVFRARVEWQSPAVFTL